MSLPKMSEYVMTAFKDKCRNKNNKISLRINVNELLEKNRTIWTKIEESKIIKLYALPVLMTDI